MKTPELTFVIPTYRLRDVAETVDAYDEHFWRNGHDVRIVVFDDGTAANRENYYGLLERNDTYSPVYYVGPKEKEQFLAHVMSRLRDKKLGALVKSLFRPSYGGNRNPFFPTRLRFEDYSYRLWAQHPGVASAHVDAVQTHAKNNYMRNPPADEIFNEEVANLLKRKIKSTMTHTDDLSFAFDYEGEVTSADCEEILERIGSLHRRSHEARLRALDPARQEALHAFGINLQRAFYGFEPDFFQQNLARTVDDVVTEIKASLEVWPTLVEICFFEKSRRGLPETLVNNQRLR